MTLEELISRVPEGQLHRITHVAAGPNDHLLPYMLIYDFLQNTTYVPTPDMDWDARMKLKHEFDDHIRTITTLLA